MSDRKTGIPTRRASSSSAASFIGEFLPSGEPNKARKVLKSAKNSKITAKKAAESTRIRGDSAPSKPTNKRRRDSENGQQLQVAKKLLRRGYKSDKEDFQSDSEAEFTGLGFVYSTPPNGRTFRQKPLRMSFPTNKYGKGPQSSTPGSSETPSIPIFDGFSSVTLSAVGDSPTNPKPSIVVPSGTNGGPGSSEKTTNSSQGPDASKLVEEQTESTMDTGTSESPKKIGEDLAIGSLTLAEIKFDDLKHFLDDRIEGLSKSSDLKIEAFTNTVDKKLEDVLVRQTRLESEVADKLDSIDEKINSAVEKAVGGRKTSQGQPESATRRPYDPTSMVGNKVYYSSAHRLLEEAAEASRELIVFEIPMSTAKEGEQRKVDDAKAVTDFFRKALKGNDDAQVIYDLQNRAKNNVKFIRRHTRSVNYKGDANDPTPLSVVFLSKEAASRTLEVAGLNGFRNVKQQIPRNVRDANKIAYDNMLDMRENAPEGVDFRLEGAGLKKIVKIRTEVRPKKSEKRPNGKGEEDLLGENETESEALETLQKKIVSLERKYRESEAEKLVTKVEITQLRTILKGIDPEHQAIRM